MVYWKRMKGIREDFRCPECGLVVDGDSFDEDEDLCYSCLFPELSDRRPAEFSRVNGFPENRTLEGQRLDSLEFLHHDNRNKKRKVYK